MVRRIVTIFGGEMNKHEIEAIKRLAANHDFKGLPIPELCDLAILGAMLRDSWAAEYFQPSAEAYWDTRKELHIAKEDYLKAESKRQRGDFDQRYPGIV